MFIKKYGKVGGPGFVILILFLVVFSEYSVQYKYSIFIITFFYSDISLI